MKEYRRGLDIAPLIINLGTRWRREFSLMLWLLYHHQLQLKLQNQVRHN